eukprot:scaffold31_cov334-Pavlova_lutheri.AAC.69
MHGPSIRARTLFQATFVMPRSNSSSPSPSRRASTRSIPFRVNDARESCIGEMAKLVRCIRSQDGAELWTPGDRSRMSPVPVTGSMKGHAFALVRLFVIET